MKNESYKEDVQCRCDYRKGYVFIHEPTNNCTCSPMTEDCSCHRIYCKNSSFIVSEGICVLFNLLYSIIKLQTYSKIVRKRCKFIIPIETNMHQRPKDKGGRIIVCLK